MSIIKEELSGVVTLSLAVKTADGVLVKDDRVKITDDNEVGLISANNDIVFGYVLVPNKEASGDATIVTRGKRVSDETTGAAYNAGDPVSVNSADKIVKATSVNATGTITVVDYSLIDSGDTITVNGVALTAGGTDFTAATSNTVTALAIATAINNKVAGVHATCAPSAAAVVVSALVPGQAGNSIALATSMDAGEGTVSGTTLTGGIDEVAMGLALEESTGADQTKSVLWF